MTAPDPNLLGRWGALLWEGAPSASRATVCRRGRPDRGASAVEYGLLIAGVAALIVVAVFAFGGGVQNLFDDTCASVETRTSTSNC